MTATVTAIRAPQATRLVPLPLLSRAQRRTELERLSEECTIGVPPSEAAQNILAAAFAHPSLKAADVAQRWADFLGEVRRVQAVEANEPDFRDVSPQMCHEDCEAALGDLVDGTDRYRGDRAR